MGQSIVCVYCSATVLGKRSLAKFCSVRCREKAWHTAHPEYREGYRQRNKEKHRADHAVYHRKNRDALIAKNKAWKAKNPEKRHASALRAALRRYGMTPEEFAAMLKAQDGRCAVCGVTKPNGAKRQRRMFVDHDHETGKVRGLLCHGCNSARGLVRENPAVLRELARYIETHNPNRRILWAA